MNKNIKYIISTLLVLSLLANPIVILNKNNTAKAYYQEELSQEDLLQESSEYPEYEIYEEPVYALNVEAGGPYQGVPGGVINFYGTFETLFTGINVTGYVWNFGDGESYHHDFDESPVSNYCNASHLYPNYGHYTASLNIIYNLDSTYYEGVKDYKSKYPYKKPLLVDRDTATVDIVYPDPWDDEHHPNNYFKKQVWDETYGWTETTNLSVGDNIMFKISYTPTSRTDNVEIKDYLPPTVKFVSSSIPPDSEQTKIYSYQNGNKYLPTKIFTWDIGDLNSGVTTEIFINGVVEYLPKSYFGLPDDDIDIYYKTENYVTLRGTRYSQGCGNAYTVRFTDTADFTIIQENPNLKIEKKVKWNCCGEYNTNVVKANKGDWVTFWLKVKNEGDVDFQDVNVSDSLPLGLSYNDNATVNGILQEPVFIDDNNFYWKVGKLEVGDTVDITFQANVDECGLFKNIAMVKGYHNNEEFTDDDDASVKVDCIPNVLIEKTVRKTPCDPWIEHVGLELNDEIFFKLDVINTGETILELIVSDVLPDNLIYINNSANYTPTINGQTLNWLFLDVNPNEHIEIIYRAKVIDCGYGINWAYTSDRGQNVFDEDNATVNILCAPNISVDKKVKLTCCNDCEYNDSIYVHLDDLVNFKIEVENTGLIPIDIIITDTLPIGFIYSDNAKVDGESHEYDDIITPLNGNVIYIWNLGVLEPGETVNLTFDALVDECGNILNEVCATGVNNTYEVSDYDSAEVFVLCPEINISKSADKSKIHSGDLVTYEYIVTNTGNCPLSNIVVTDDQGLVPVYVSGDLNDDDWLDCDETWIYRVSGYPTEDVTNIGTVTGEDELGKVVSDDDDASVDVINPDITVVKTVSPACVLPGGQATWNITVENTGDVTLYDVFVIDDNIGIIDSMITLDPLEKRYYEYTTNPSVETTNNVLVNGTDILGYEVTDSSSATVEICETNIDFDVEKIVKWNCLGITYGNYIYSHVSDWVTFKITIENTGDLSLDFDVCDILPENLTMFGQPQVNGVPVDPVDMCWEINNVQSGGKITILFKAIVEECGEHFNRIVVTGYHEGFDPIIKEENATVFAICPDININKTADSNLVSPGQEVTYTYKVTNTGNHHLKNVIVSDDKISSISFVSGDDNSDGWLDIDETWIYQAKADIYEETTNTGTVTASDELNREVSDSDDETVLVEECPPTELDLDINKTVVRKCCNDCEYSDFTYAYIDDMLAFKIEITNTGDEALNIVLEDELPNGLVYSDNARVDGVSDEFDDSTTFNDHILYTWNLGILQPEETVNLTFDVLVVECGNLVNNVTVTGTFEDLDPIIVEDNATVFSLCPEIDIVKTAFPTIIESGEEVTYTYDVSNIGNCDLYNVVLTDDQGLTPILVSGDDGDNILEIGETWMFQATAYPSEDVTNIGTVIAEDILKKSVSSDDSATVDVDEEGCIPEISVDKQIFDGENWVDDLVTEEDYPLDVMFKIIVENKGTCDLDDIVIIDTMNCGIEDPRDFTGGISHVINGHVITWDVPGDISHNSAPIILTFNATVYKDTINVVSCKANSTDDNTQVSSDDQVEISFEEQTVNHPPRKPVNPKPENSKENVSINPKLSVFVEDTDDDILTVKFYNASNDVLIDSVENAASGTRVEITWGDLDFNKSYSWYVEVEDSEYKNTSDVFNFKTKGDTGSTPYIEIITPMSGSLYFKDRHIPLPFIETAVILGGINISADISDEDDDISKVEFLIDGKVVNSTSDKNFYHYNQFTIGWITIKIKAYDEMDNVAEESVEVFIINFGL